MMSTVLIIAILLIKMDAPYNEIFTLKSLEMFQPRDLVPAFLLLAAIGCEAVGDYRQQALKPKIRKDRLTYHRHFADVSYERITSTITAHSLKQFFSDFVATSSNIHFRPILDRADRLRVSLDSIHDGDTVAFAKFMNTNRVDIKITSSGCRI